MSEPTVGFEGEEGTPVTKTKGWHEHPECLDDQGRPLAHLHGWFGTTPAPHTHLPIKAWGPAVPTDG